MDEKTKEGILINFKKLFKDKIIVNHIKNLKKLNKLSAFDNNPFLFKYLAIFLAGKMDATALAKSLIYPRILGSSIATSFGQNLQSAAPDIFQSVLGSTTSGIDLEFIDQLDGRKKYCQIKSGPNTINKDDVETVVNHFRKVINISRTNNANVGIGDMVVGVLYGIPRQISANYKKIQESYPVFVGQEFWFRLTGDEYFYDSLIEVFGQVALEVGANKVLDKVIKELASDIQNTLIKKEQELS